MGEVGCIPDIKCQNLEVEGALMGNANQLMRVKTGALTFNLPTFIDLSSIQNLTAQAAGVVAVNNTITNDTTHVVLTAGGADLRVYIDNGTTSVGHTVSLMNGANAVELSVYDSAGGTPRVLSVLTDNAFVTVTSTSLTLGNADHLEAELTTALKLYRCTKVNSTDWIIYPMLDAVAASTTN